MQHGPRRPNISEFSDDNLLRCRTNANESFILLICPQRIHFISFKNEKTFACDVKVNLCLNLYSRDGEFSVEDVLKSEEKIATDTLWFHHNFDMMRWITAH